MNMVGQVFVIFITIYGSKYKSIILSLKLEEEKVDDDEEDLLLHF